MLKIIIYNIENTPEFHELYQQSSLFAEIYFSDYQVSKKDLLPPFLQKNFISLSELDRQTYNFFVINGDQNTLNELNSRLSFFATPIMIDSQKIKLKFDFLQLIKFFSDMDSYSSLNTRPDFCITDEDLYPILYDHLAPAGSATNYFFQDLWAAYKINKLHPDMHYDVGSRLDGFIANLLAAQQPVTMLDIRPLPYTIPGLSFIQADATNMANIDDNSIFSLSALSSVEHFGLGRYGDPIDPDACFKTMTAFERVLAPGGHLYFAVPIGFQNRLCFNAHRIFTPQTVIACFPHLELCEFAYVHNNAVISFSNEQWIQNAESITAKLDKYIYGLFEFIKPI